MSGIEHCLLGLIEQGDCSGYDLRKILTQTPMRHYSDSPGSIYPALERLKRRRWIVSVRDRASHRHRSTYRVTKKGRAELKRWLMQPVTEREVADRLDDLNLRLAFHHLLGERATLAKFMHEYAASARSFAASVRRYIRLAAREYPSSARLALGAGLATCESLARWAAAESRKLRRKPARKAKQKLRSLT